MRNLICDWNGIWQISENTNNELIVSTPGKDRKSLENIEATYVAEFAEKY